MKAADCHYPIAYAANLPLAVCCVANLPSTCLLVSCSLLVDATTATTAITVGRLCYMNQNDSLVIYLGFKHADGLFPACRHLHYLESTANTRSTEDLHSLLTYLNHSLNAKHSEAY